MLVCPAGLIEYEYGPDSFHRHQALAQAVGARVEICEFKSLSLDLDLPEDLSVIEKEFEI
jgi:2-phospho-L-lactate guanylyltransferase (CobY/MobA/RfbA family)